MGIDVFEMAFILAKREGTTDGGMDLFRSLIRSSPCHRENKWIKAFEQNPPATQKCSNSCNFPTGCVLAGHHCFCKENCALSGCWFFFFFVFFLAFFLVGVWRLCFQLSNRKIWKRLLLLWKRPNVNNDSRNTSALSQSLLSIVLLLSAYWWAMAHRDEMELQHMASRAVHVWLSSWEDAALESALCSCSLESTSYELYEDLCVYPSKVKVFKGFRK